MAAINDAVMVPIDRYDNIDHETSNQYVPVQCLIKRVEFVADGLAIVNSKNSHYREPKDRKWPVVGRFVPVRRWLFWTGWQFVPNEK